MKKLLEIIRCFEVEGEIVQCSPLGEGIINDTFFVATESGHGRREYILQNINNFVFHDIDALMDNITRVTDFVRAKVAMEGGDQERQVLRVIKTRDGKAYKYDNQSGKYFRMYAYINDSVTYQSAKTTAVFEEAAHAFGGFANYLYDFDASKVVEVIPDFHNTKKRYTNLLYAAEIGMGERIKESLPELNFIAERAKTACTICDLIENGKMPLRVTHNDTKLNNVLFDRFTGKHLAVVDLDTIMPGSVCSDFGDGARFGCCTCAEDERDLSKVGFNLELFDAYARGYLAGYGDHIGKVEKDNLALSVFVFSCELGIRFLEDYLRGDLYFKVKRDKHNLERARCQFRLARVVEENLDKMKNIIEKY